MRTAAYVTASTCGLGHAVRGVALVQAGQRAGIEVRAFGPPKDGDLPGYEGSFDWQARVTAWSPDLLLGDLSWIPLLKLKDELGAAGWLLMRWMDPSWLLDRYEFKIAQWDRRISIEPAEDAAPGITHRIPPVIVNPPRLAPVDGQELQAGYNTYWEAVWLGYRDRVRWISGGSPERQARIAAGGRMTENGADALMRMIAAG